MIKYLFYACLFVSTFATAQHTIKGEMDPVADYPWMLLYKLKGAKQDFIAYDSIINGKFEITVPNNASSGIYRLLYDQKNQLFLDVIYDQEDIELRFHPQDPNSIVQFSNSSTNTIYYNYLRTISTAQQQLDSMQVDFFKPNANGAIAIIYNKKYNDVLKIQDHFEKMAKGSLAFHFIKSSARYNPVKPIKNPEDYLQKIQDHFFDHIDLNSDLLDHSTFKNDKINDYIFSLTSTDDPKTETKLRKEAINRVLEKIKMNVALSKNIQESLLYSFAQQENVIMTNHVLNHYLQLPKELQDPGFIKDVKGQLRTAIGNIAPNILWEENGTQKTLHKLSGASNFLVVFWSSGCSHCLKELPLLKEYLKDKPHINVIAVGLEDAQSTLIWQREIEKYSNWTHVYGVDKWKNRFANEYGVNATPSFYLLDAQKKILAKPEDVQELKEVFK
ncbi:MAG: TlpA family protein disulfide reductase [Flavobacteriaceae bacterium]|nr:TlpA family protein disulfide reductase [Flavobacteriaceae bacterium]